MSNPLTDPGAEELLAGMLLSDPSRLDDESISPAYLKDPVVKQLVQSAASLRITGREVSPVNLGIESGSPEVEILSEKLTSGVLPAGDFKTVRDHISNLALRRRAAGVCKKFYEMSFDNDVDAKSLVSEIERTVLKIRQDRSEGLKEGSDLTEVVDEMEWRMGNPGRVRGLTFGCPRSEKLIGGFQGGQTYVIAARPSVGKTGLITTIILNLLNQGVKPCVFSLEMKGLLIKQRILASLSGVPISITDSRPYSEPELARIHHAISELRNKGWKYSDQGRVDIEEIESKARRLKVKEGFDILFLDYLQIIKNRALDNRDRRLSVGDISARLKALAIELDIPVVMAAQLKRKDGYYDRDLKRTVHAPPELEDLKESGDIEQDADVVALLERDQRNNAQSATVHWAKNRNGGTDSYHFDFRPETTTFKESQTQDEPFSD